MLSKSQSRRFFLGGTILFSLIFLGLTVDTMRSIPGRTHEENLDAAVARGNHLWTSNNCMGCHTILGEGAYYAPELTKVYTRRGEAWIKLFLENPEAMYPGERRMPRYGFSEAEKSDLVAFFKWVGDIDNNNWPPKPDLAVATAQAAAAPAPTPGAVDARPALFANVCVGCHTLEGKGGNVGPALDGVGNRLTEAQLATWLADPQAVKPGTAMPKIPMSDAERNELAAFLAAKH